MATSSSSHCLTAPTIGGAPVNSDVRPFMPKPPYEPKDRNGLRIQVGDKVRIVSIPDLSGMAPDGISESLPVFEYLLGRYKKVARFDELGFAWVDFFIPSGKFKGWHGVAIEPFLLHLPRSRPSASLNQTRTKATCVD